ncbi:MAG: hypothetical protein ACRCYE_06320 [Sarcina sp.]
MKKTKILVSIGAIIAILAVGTYKGYQTINANKNTTKVENHMALVAPSTSTSASTTPASAANTSVQPKLNLTPAEVSFNDQINKVMSENIENTNPNIEISNKMVTTPAPIAIANGCYVPQGTFEAPILLKDGNYHTDYLITGMVTSNQNIPVYNNILDGSGPIQYYPAGTNLLVVGYVDGYYILGSGAGDVSGLGYKRDTYVKASNMTLIPNESNLYALTLGNMPYTVDFMQNANNQPMKLYKYPTDLSDVVGVISPSALSTNPAQNQAKVINTANKMQDVSFDGKSGWVLTSNEFPVRYVSSAYSPNNDGND